MATQIDEKTMPVNTATGDKEVIAIDLRNIEDHLEEHFINAKCFNEVGNSLLEYQSLSKASSLLQLVFESKIPLCDERAEILQAQRQNVEDSLYYLQDKLKVTYTSTVWHYRLWSFKTNKIRKSFA